MAAIRWKDDDEGRLIHLEGELDHTGCAEVAGNFRAAATDAGNVVVVDMEGVPFVASQGLRLLLQVHRALKDKGATLRVRGLVPQVRKVFETTGVFQAIPELEA